MYWPLLFHVLGKCLMLDYAYDTQSTDDRSGRIIAGKFVGLKTVEVMITIINLLNALVSLAS